MNKEIEQIIKKNKYRSKFYEQYKPKKKHKRIPVQTSLPSGGKKKNEEDKPSRWVVFINRVLASGLVLMVLLVSKDNQQLSKVYDYSFSHMNFSKVDTYITTVYGRLFPLPKQDTLYVNDSLVTLNNTSSYKDGVIVSTNLFEAVESHTKGIVVNVYQDEELGQVIVIQDEQGRLFSYGLMDDVKVGLYRRISYGEVIGVSQTDSSYEKGEYYLAISDGQQYLDVVSVVNDED